MTDTVRIIKKRNIIIKNIEYIFDTPPNNMYNHALRIFAYDI